LNNIKNSANLKAVNVIPIRLGKVNDIYIYNCNEIGI
jgi:hypothetical protein